jgi:lipid-binding SYLF domain-containing protein
MVLRGVKRNWVLGVGAGLLPARGELAGVVVKYLPDWGMMEISDRWRWSGLLCVVLAISVGFGAGEAEGKDRTKLDVEIRQSGDLLDLLQSDPNKAIPAQVLAKAEGIVIMREYKAGFVFGVKGGGGVALIRDPKTGSWTPPAFVNSGEGSFGWQIGGEKTDTVMLLMDQAGMGVLEGGGLKVGVDVSASAGPVSGGGQANFDNIKEPVLVYATSKGLFAGASIQGGGVAAAKKDNLFYYGMSMRDVHLSGRAKMSAAGQGLVDKINRYAGGKRGVPQAAIPPAPVIPPAAPVVVTPPSPSTLSPLPPTPAPLAQPTPAPAAPLPPLPSTPGEAPSEPAPAPGDVPASSPPVPVPVPLPPLPPPPVQPVP